MDKGQHRYILRASKSTARFGNEALGEDLKFFDLNLIHAIEAYLLTIYFILFSSVMTTFEIFHHQKFGMEKYVIPNFGVTTAILNPVGIFCRWCNFGLLQGRTGYITPFFLE